MQSFIVTIILDIMESSLMINILLSGLNETSKNNQG